MPYDDDHPHHACRLETLQGIRETASFIELDYGGRLVLSTDELHPGWRGLLHTGAVVHLEYSGYLVAGVDVIVDGRTVRLWPNQQHAVGVLIATDGS